MNLNKVFLIGRVTRDPEIRSLPSGQQVASFGLATDRYYQDNNGQKQQKTEFHNIVTFGKTSDIVSQYLKKGSLVFIEGRLQTRTWEDSNGNKRNRTEIIAERIQLGPKSYKDNTATSNREPEQKEEIPIIEEIEVEDIPL
jgi:single-strand DNA-binding protein